MICYKLRYEILDYEKNEILYVYENTFERLYWRRDYVIIWRVKHICHLHVRYNSICSHLICLFLFHGRYIRQILRIPCISSERIRLSYVTLGMSFFRFGFSMVYIFSGSRNYFDQQDRVMRNKSFTFLFTVYCVFRFISLQFSMTKIFFL